MTVRQFKYQNHWPIWCIMDGDVVIQCFLTEDKANIFMLKYDPASKEIQHA